MKAATSVRAALPKRLAIWTQWQDTTVLAPVPHRQVVLTIPSPSGSAPIACTGVMRPTPVRRRSAGHLSSARTPRDHEGPFGVRGSHAATRSAVLARLAIARYPQQTPIQIPIPVNNLLVIYT